MPAISIDLPKTKHGYAVNAEEVFWVSEGILRSTDLRDSMDEQYIADIAASVVGGQLLTRSKEALDTLYEAGSSESERVAKALDVYGQDRFKIEFKYCVDELLKVANVETPQKLRSILFKSQTSNPFPSVFSALLIAFHESLVVGKKKISSYAGVKAALVNLSERIDTTRRATNPEERRRNIDSIKGLISPHLVDGQSLNYTGGHSSTDIDAVIRRSEIEVPSYELKQGILRLNDAKTLDENVMDKVIRTICAIANNGKDRVGTVLVGVSDKEADADRVATLYSISPRRVSGRHVVGVKREAEALGITAEEYFGRWKNAIRNSSLSQPLRDAVLSSIDYNDYFGLGVIAISIPAQRELSYVGEKLYRREGDETVEVNDVRGAAQLAARLPGAGVTNAQVRLSLR